MQKILERNRSDIRQTERQLKDNRAKAEDVRTQLLLAEFKRDAAQKELDSLLDEIQDQNFSINKQLSDVGDMSTNKVNLTTEEVRLHLI